MYIKNFLKNISMILYDYDNFFVKIRDSHKNLLKFERIQNYNSNVERDKLLYYSLYNLSFKYIILNNINNYKFCKILVLI